MDHDSSRALKTLTIALSIVYVIVFVIMLVWHPGSEVFYKDFFNTYQIIPPFFAGVCGVALAKR
ncbi:MAG: hypothetical protein JWN98_2386, partial [Abditibacteriota bacterium]|nr:hypothetical protein [Abditibacteriota bacterium]